MFKAELLLLLSDSSSCFLQFKRRVLPPCFKASCIVFLNPCLSSEKGFVLVLCMPCMHICLIHCLFMFYSSKVDWTFALLLLCFFQISIQNKYERNLNPFSFTYLTYWQVLKCIISHRWSSICCHHHTQSGQCHIKSDTSENSLM